MAGISGIIKKKSNSIDSSILVEALQSMMLKLCADKGQKRNSITLKNCCFGTVAPLSSKTNSNFIYNSALEIYCILDGLIYVPLAEKLLIQKTYIVDTALTEYEYIPYLYNHYKANYIKHITGWFNILIFDVQNELPMLSNDRLGLLPLYFYETDSIFIFASKLESILASGLIRKIEFDAVTITEHLLFNYPISANTFIKSISTLPAAVHCTFSDTFIQSIYWNPGELISSSPLSKKKSLDLIDDTLKHVINKPFSRDDSPVGATLTGGWDGRLVLAYMLPKYRERLRVFSFGAELSPDVVIPMEIARMEGFSYTPFILNQDYINDSFLDSAFKTILYSNGMRGYRRSQYIYAAQQLALISEIFVSGNFGDEMLKFAKVFPSEVITKELISIIESGFTIRPQLPQGGNSLFSNLADNSMIKEKLYARLDLLEKEVAGYATLSEKFHHLKLTRIAGKYFGTEINSYNDFICNFSPFLDFDFISAFSQTSFSGNYYPFNCNRLKHKEMSSMLYAELIKRNNRSFLHYNTDKGFSIADMAHPIGKFAVLYKKKFSKKQPIKDPYFLEQTDKLFQSFSESFSRKLNSNLSGQPLSLNPEYYDLNQKGKLMSLMYWMNYITKEYSL